MRAFCTALSKHTNNMQVIQTQNHLQEWTDQNEPIGKMLGYPQCCINQFCSQPPAALKHHGATPDDRARYQAAHLNGQYTGFIPCTAHAQQILAGTVKITDLINNRNPMFPPFPDLK